MAVHDLLYSHLTTDAGISALVGNAVYPLRLPQKPSIPAITYRKVSDSGYTGISKMHRDRYQFTLYARKYVEVNSVAVALQTALEDYYRSDGAPSVAGAWKLNHVDFYDDETELFGIVSDYALVVCD